MTVKTDNHNPKAKLDLRRYFLKKYHANDPPRVLDCCQGGGLLWDQLRREFSVASYWGLDVKPKKGRLKLESSRVLAQPGWSQNVIDVDAYGAPWKHWEGILENSSGPITVFLTIGSIMFKGSVDKHSFKAMGLERLAEKLPKSFSHKLSEIAVSYSLARSFVFGKITTEAVEATNKGNARYVGIRLEPAKTAGPESLVPVPPKRAKAKKEPSNV